MNENKEDDQREYPTNTPFEWNRFFGTWLAETARGLPFVDVQNHILSPIRDAWKGTTRLTTDLARGFILQQLGSTQQLPKELHLAWREISTWVLESQEVQRGTSRRYFERDVDDTLAMLIFVEFGVSFLTAEWPHAKEFTDVFTTWIQQVGHHPDCFSQLLVALDAPGWAFAPDPMLYWLDAIVGRVAEPSSFWREHHNSKRAAQLLQRVWTSYGDSIKSDLNVVQVYSGLLDNLVGAGEPIAARLRDVLESSP